MTILEDFQKFIQRGSVVDLAVGMVMGAAFTAIVNSFVEDIISPVIGLLMGKDLLWSRNFPQRRLVWMFSC
jgi:large conductance mechanosensitive channel